MNATEINYILDKHRKWLCGEPGGERADLRGSYLSGAEFRYADLSGADLRYADLRDAILSGADLSGAYLCEADLRGAYLCDAYLYNAYLRGADLRDAKLREADLRGADLRDVDLRSANLNPIKEDFFNKLELAKGEVVGLYDHLIRGKINGSCYEGECACFVGTIANIRKEDYQHLTNGLRPESSSPTEKWFLGIRKGDTPQSNQIAGITKEWIEEFAKANGISLPNYKLISSVEFPSAFDVGT
jgi:hypothetical protein